MAHLWSHTQLKTHTWNKAEEKDESKISKHDLRNSGVNKLNGKRNRMNGFEGK